MNLDKNKITKVLLPTDEEVLEWLLFVLKHSIHVEYFLHLLGWGKSDPEHPHDLVGFGNKYEWEVIKGFALQYRKPPVDFEKYILPALTLHRNQYHHRKWNCPDPNDLTKKNSEATEDDMLLGSVDAICSLLEDREYQGGAHSYDEAKKIVGQSMPHKIWWINRVISKMENLEQPNLELITNLKDFPNIGLSNDIYNSIVKRTKEVVEMLKNQHGYLKNY